MRATNIVRLLPVFLILFVGVGCDNQQELIEAIKNEKTEIQKQLTEASDKASKLLAENESLQKGLETAKAAAAKVEESLTNAKKTAAEALTKAVAEVQAKMASAEAESKKAISAADEKLAALQQQLNEANAKVTELEAALEKATQATEEETPAEP